MAKLKEGYLIYLLRNTFYFAQIKNNKKQNKNKKYSKQKRE